MQLKAAQCENNGPFIPLQNLVSKFLEDKTVQKLITKQLDSPAPAVTNYFLITKNEKNQPVPAGTPPPIITRTIIA